MNPDVKNGTIIDDKPQVINADLRKFNKAKDQVDKAIVALTAIHVTNQDDCNSALDVLKLAKKVETVIENKRKDLVQPFNGAVKEINAYAKKLTDKLPPAIADAKQKILTWQKDEEKRQQKERTTSRINQLVTLAFAPVSDGNSDDWTGFINGDITVEKYVVENYDDANWTIKVNQVASSINERNRLVLQQKESQLEEDLMFGSSEEVENAQQEINTLQSTVTAPVMQQGSYFAPKVKGITKRWTFEITDITLVPRDFLMVNEKAIRDAIGNGTRGIAGVRIFQEEGLTIR